MIFAFGRRSSEELRLMRQALAQAAGLPDAIRARDAALQELARERALHVETHRALAEATGPRARAALKREIEQERIRRIRQEIEREIAPEQRDRVDWDAVDWDGL